MPPHPLEIVPAATEFARSGRSTDLTHSLSSTIIRYGANSRILGAPPECVPIALVAHPDAQELALTMLVLTRI